MTDRIKTVDLSDHATLMECYIGLNKTCADLRAENEKLRDELLHWKYTETEMTDTIIARIMWDAYAAQAGGKTFDGKPLPTWEELGEERQACWLAAASAAAAAIREGERDV